MQIGDKVVILKDYYNDNRFIGKIGTIVMIDMFRKHPYYVGISYDEFTLYRHCKARPLTLLEKALNEE